MRDSGGAIFTGEKTGRTEWLDRATKQTRHYSIKMNKCTATFELFNKRKITPRIHKAATTYLRFCLNITLSLSFLTLSFR
jgi:hypothetical protein